jgi:hypothetical protein
VGSASFYVAARAIGFYSSNTTLHRLERVCETSRHEHHDHHCNPGQSQRWPDLAIPPATWGDQAPRARQQGDVTTRADVVRDDITPEAAEAACVTPMIDTWRCGRYQNRVPSRRKFPCRLGAGGTLADRVLDAAQRLCLANAAIDGMINPAMPDPSPSELINTCTP